MLGSYENFPKVIHGRARFTCEGSTREIQQAILCSFHELNKRVYRSDLIVRHLSQEWEVGFEFGIAEGMGFNYLDTGELERLKKLLIKKELPTMDFFCTVHYHTINENGKRVPLRFDYHLIRFTFHRKTIDLLVHHERGSQHVPLHDFINFITSYINEELTKEHLKPLDLEYLRAL